MKTKSVAVPSSHQLLNTLNDMAKMALLAKKGDWEGFQLLEANWLDNFIGQLNAVTDMSLSEKEALLKTVIQQVDAIIEKAQQDMQQLQANHFKDVQNFESVNQYLKI